MAIREQAIIEVEGRDAGARRLLRELEREIDRLEGGNARTQTSITRASQAARSSARDFNVMSTSIGKASAALATFFTAQQVARFVQGTLQHADAMGKLAQRTGGAVEVLSVLAFAAERADLTTSDLESAIQQLTRRLAEVRRGGGQEAAAALQAIGLSAEELEGLTADQQILRIANAIERFADGPEKASAAMALFGRTGDRLLPLMREISGDGFGQLEEAARRAGVVIDTDTAAAAERFNDQMMALVQTLRGFVLGPGADVISLVGGLVTGLTNAITAVRELREEWELFSATTAIATAPLRALIGLLNRLRGEQRQAEAAADAAAGNEDRPRITLAQSSAILRARIAALQAEGEAEVRIAIERNRASERENEAAFAQGLISLQDFLRRREELLLDSAAKELGILRAQRELLARTPLDETGKTVEQIEVERIQRKQQLFALDAQIEAARIRAEAAANQLTAEGIELQKRLNDERLGFEQRIREARGQTAEASQIAIDKEVEAYDRLLRQLNLTTEARERETAALRAALSGVSGAQEIEREVSERLARQGQDIADVQTRVEAGILSERQAREQILDIYRETQELLGVLIERSETLAAISGNPEVLKLTAELRAEYARLGVTIEATANESARLTAAIRDSAETGLADIFSGIGTRIQGIGDALRVILDGVQRVFAEALARIIVERASEALGQVAGGAASQAPAVAAAAQTTAAAGALTAAGGVVTASATAMSAAAAALSGAGAVVFGAATALQVAAAQLAVSQVAAALPAFGLPLAHGGFVTGPGGPTSDSIAARLSAGEYVIRAAVVDRLGVDFFDALNGARTPAIRSARGFASGGVVQAAGGDEAGASLTAMLGLEDGLVMRELETNAGARTLIRVLGKNRGVLRQILGVGSR